MDGHQDLPQPSAFDAFPPPFVGDAVLAGEPTLSVVLPDEPAPRRMGLLVGVALFVVVALGLGAFLLLRNDDKAAAYSLQQAATAASTQQAMAFTLTMETMGQEIVIDAEADNTSGLTRMTMQMDGLGFGNAGIKMIVDAPNEVIYISSDLFSAIGLDVASEWIKMDKAFLADSGDDSMFDAANSGNVLQAGEIVEQASTKEDLGLEEIDGEQLRHYRVTLDLAKALELSPQLEDSFAELDADLPTEVPYDMWVTEDNELRRVLIELDLGATVVKIDQVIRMLDGPLVIEIPADADVTPAGDLL